MNVPMRKFGAMVSLLVSALALVTEGKAQQDASTAGTTGEVQKLEKYTVTGSNIPTTLTSAEAGTYPLVQLDRVTIESTGYENAAALLQKLTISNSGSIAISNNATGFTPGATGVSLRGLGPEATLVLINDHRVAPYPVGQSGDTAFVDLNTIPLGMIESIEVLKDGASSIYGADAVAGVVNVHLRKNYNGSEAFVGYQNTTDKDSSQFTANLVSGVSSDKGSITVGFNYQSRASIANRDRGYSAVPAFLSSNSSPINAQLGALAVQEALGTNTNPSGVSATKTVYFGTPGPLTSDGLPTSSNNNGAVPPSQWHYSSGRSAVYNYNQDSLSFPSWTRYGFLVNGERKLFDSENLRGYFDGSYQNSMTENQLAPSATGSFATPGQTTLVIPARTANPILSIIQGSTIQQIAAGTPVPSGWAVGPGTQVDANGNAQRIAAAGAYNPYNPFNQDITGGTRFRTKEFGNRIFHDTNNAFMATAGVRGTDILGKFDFDAGFRYSEITFRGNDTLVSSSRFNDVLNANSTLIQNAGIPAYNPFGYYANPIPANAAVTSLAKVHTHDVDTSSIGNGFLTINTTDLFEVPAGPAGAALGLDYRIESLDQSPDTENASGDIIGSSPAAVTDHSRKIWAVYGEVQVPVTTPKQNIPGAYDLSLNVSGRYEGFLTSGDHTAVPKIGVRYQPVDDSLTLRASASKGFLAPSLYKLYAGSIASLLGLTDPRTGEDMPETPTLVSGNSKLKAETSKAYNVGFVWTPKMQFLKGFTTNVDLWRIERDGTALYDLQNTLDRWGAAGATGNSGLLSGEAVVLDPGGNITQVVTQYHNAGKTIAKGADVGASYTYPTQNMGKFDVSAALSYLQSFKQASIPGAALDELVNETTDGEGQDAYLRRKGRTELRWTYHGYRALLAGNFTDGFHDYDLDGNDRHVASTWTWDLQLAYTIHNEFGPYFKDTTVTVGGINIFKRTPPLSQFFGNNPNNYPGFIYTSEDRMVYVNLTKRF
jgi:iron complex outermembrane receptor protein